LATEGSKGGIVLASFRHGPVQGALDHEVIDLRRHGGRLRGAYNLGMAYALGFIVVASSLLLLAAVITGRVSARTCCTYIPPERDARMRTALAHDEAVASAERRAVIRSRQQG
jgi:hypothetical protein